MSFTRCKVSSGKFGLEVRHNGNFYKIGSFSVPCVKVGKEYDFLLEEYENEGRTVRWANLPKEKRELLEEETKKTTTKKTTTKKSTEKKIPAKATVEPAPTNEPAQQSGISIKILERIADALEGIESLMEALVENGSKKNSKS